MAESEHEKSQNAKKRKLDLLNELKTRIADGYQAGAQANLKSTGIMNRKKSDEMRGNKLAEKPDRTIEIGWIHEGLQVRSKTGGGTRKTVVSKDADASIIIEEVKKLFFPKGVSARGIKAEDVNFEVCDFSLRVHPPNQTVGDTYKKEKPCGNLRYYLSSSLKPSTESQSKHDILQPSSETSSQQDLNSGPTSGPTEDCDVAKSESGGVRPKPSPESKLSSMKSKHLTDKSKHAILPTSQKTAQPDSNSGPTSGPTKDFDVAKSESGAVLSKPSSESKLSSKKLKPLTDQSNPDVLHTSGKSAQPSNSGRIVNFDVHVPISGLYPVIDGNVRLPTPSLNVFYSKDIKSKFSDKTSRITCLKSECIYDNVDEEGNPRDTNEIVEPLNNGYFISEVSKVNKVFMRIAPESQQDSNYQYEFPCKPDAESLEFNGMILHHPTEVYGSENGELKMGVICEHHNNVSYEWYCNGQQICSGKCIITIEKPGEYLCIVKATFQDEMDTVKEVTHVSNPVMVINLDATKLLPQLSSAAVTVAQNTDMKDVCFERDIKCDFKNSINQGSFGEVFKGTYQNDDVAIKRVKMKKGKRPERLIINEAEVHKQLHHENIVKFIGMYMDSSHVFIVTEYISGSNMEDTIYLLDNIDIPQKKVSVSIGVLEGVAYLHEHNPQIVHEDIKPANILLDANMSPKLCDLGMSRARSFDVVSSTTGLYVVGTPAYMAPEKLLENKKGKPSSDIWSVGITLLEWFSGGDPWDLQNQEDDPVNYIRECMQKSELPPVSNRFPILLPALSYNPEDRPTARNLVHKFRCPSCSKSIQLDD